MINGDLYHVTIAALELAIRAPSIHNSQPWRCSICHSLTDQRPSL